MSCCGQKRKQWMEEQHISSHEELGQIITLQEKEMPPVLFEYLGQYPLLFNGMGTGENYLFQYQGQQIAIPYRDSFSMMAEPTLKIIAQKL